MIPGYRFDLGGKKFHRLKVLRWEKKTGKNQFWRCLCDCGNETIADSYALRKGRHRSCGCLLVEMNRSRVYPPKIVKSGAFLLSEYWMKHGPVSTT